MNIRILLCLLRSPVFLVSKFNDCSSFYSIVFILNFLLDHCCYIEEKFMFAQIVKLICIVTYIYFIDHYVGVLFLLHLLCSHGFIQSHLFHLATALVKVKFLQQRVLISVFFFFLVFVAIMRNSGVKHHICLMLNCDFSCVTFSFVNLL